MNQLNSPLSSQVSRGCDRDCQPIWWETRGWEICGTQKNKATKRGRFAERRMVYAWLRAKDSLRNSNPVLDSFYLSRFTGPIGQMNHVDALLALLSDSTLMADSTAWLDTLNAARVLNNQLADTNQFIANARWVNNRYMDMLAWSIDSLLGETADSLEALANACPLIAGNAVYRARTLLGMMLPGLFYDDIELCNDQGVFKGGQSKLQEQLAALNQKGETKEIFSEGFVVFPNPASGKLFVRFPASITTGGIIDFFDVTGRNLLRQIVPVVSSVSIDVQSLPRGIVLYRFVSNNGQVYAGKVILN